MVPTIRINLLQSTHILAHQSKVVEVALCDGHNASGSFFLESSTRDSGLQVDPSLLQVEQDKPVLAVISNPTGLSVTMEEGDLLGEATQVEVVTPPQAESDPRATSQRPVVRNVQSKPDSWRKTQLKEGVGKPEMLTPPQKEEFFQFLTGHHNVFALEEYERGETDLIEMEVDTGDAHPCRSAPRRVPFTLREEIARQITHMQSAGVIQPSVSPWASPVVMVKKKDGMHHFCIDY